MVEVLVTLLVMVVILVVLLAVVVALAVVRVEMERLQVVTVVVQEEY